VVNVRHYGPSETKLDEPAEAIFQKQWELYRLGDRSSVF
jgi:hypothetical protein